MLPNLFIYPLGIDSCRLDGEYDLEMTIYWVFSCDRTVLDLSIIITITRNAIREIYVKYM